MLTTTRLRVLPEVKIAVNRLDRRERLCECGEHLHPAGRQLNPLASPREKRLADDFLKLSNALAHGTRRDREHIRSLFHSLSPGDGNEGLEKRKSSDHALNLAQLN